MPRAAKRLTDIAQAMKGADRLILATDPDREGEAISWHVLQALTQRKAIKDAKVSGWCSTPSPARPSPRR